MARTKTPKNKGVNEAVSNPSVENAVVKPAPEVEVQATSPVAEKTAKKANAPKLEAVKAEPRRNVVPINLEEEIRRLAYLMSERRGFEPGHESEDWLAAEHEVLQRYRQHSA